MPKVLMRREACICTNLPDKEFYMHEVFCQIMHIATEKKSVPRPQGSEVLAGILSARDICTGETRNTSI